MQFQIIKIAVLSLRCLAVTGIVTAFVGLVTGISLVSSPLFLLLAIVSVLLLLQTFLITQAYLTLRYLSSLLNSDLREAVQPVVRR
ncbi:MAG: hypothetical protein O3A14_17520 [Cyanobacteria bacterium]|nr:hypothetical protein [Cyanobacteriota bacterium]